MRYQKLGRTGLDVSVLSLGASPLGSVFREVSVDEARDVVRKAADLGINFIDVAPYYGLGRAEEVLGEALQGLPRSQFLLATKVGRYGKSVQDCDYSAQRIKASVDESLGRLRVDYIDLLQVHDVEFGDPHQILDEALPAIEALRQQGKTRFIGITGFPLQLLDDLTAQYPVDTVLSYGHHSLNDTALEKKLATFDARGLGVINAAPLVFGLFTSKTPPAWHPAPLEVQEACQEVARFCRTHGEPIERLAIQFATGSLKISTTLVGTASAVNLAEHARWIEEPMDADLLQAVLERLSPIHDMTWTEGRAENNYQGPPRVFD